MPTLSSLTSKLGTKLNSKKSSVTLIEVDESQRPVADDRGKINSLTLQYYPESLSDNKTVNNTTKEIPGGSLPLYQWVASGERLITFTAVFTTDMDLTEIRSPADVVTGEVAGHNPDIRSAITWLRQFELPRYLNGGEASLSSTFTQAPSRLKLVVPNSGIGMYGGDDGIFRHPDAVLCIMTQCDVTIESSFPSGLPRIATVSLAFAQVGQYRGSVVFPQRSPRTESLASGTAAPFYGYRIPRRTR